ncbi:MAG: fumarylacetoacetate hydrolase family protein [Burkholderiales bacterium]|nr:fumarylacetoacetate hydrolase family protein [Burkholderiales bacterium]
MAKFEFKNIDVLAQRMLDDYDSKNPGMLFAEGLRMNVDEAWQLQTAVASLRIKRGEKPVGYKIGCVDEGNQKMIGINHPAWGRLWDTERHTDGAQLQKSDYDNPSMEAEFGIVLGSDIDPAKAEFEDIIDAIASVHPVIEIHNFVFRGEHPKGPELLANNAIHSGVVLGNSVIDCKDRMSTDLELVYDGEVVDAWKDKRWPHDMLSALGWLIDQQAKKGIKLKKGELILTGAFGPPIPIQDKKLVECKSSALGSVSATFL